MAIVVTVLSLIAASSAFIAELCFVYLWSFKNRADLAKQAFYIAAGSYTLYTLLAINSRFLHHDL